jgi:hypothetical protein
VIDMGYYLAVSITSCVTGFLLACLLVAIYRDERAERLHEVIDKLDAEVKKLRGQLKVAEAETRLWIDLAMIDTEVDQ